MARGMVAGRVFAEGRKASNARLTALVCESRKPGRSNGGGDGAPGVLRVTDIRHCFMERQRSAQADSPFHPSARGGRRAHLDTTTVFSLSFPEGGEGRGEEATCFRAKFPSPQPPPRSGGEGAGG